MKTDISDAGVDHLAKIKTLRILKLGGTYVTKKGLDQLRRALPPRFCSVAFTNGVISLFEKSFGLLRFSLFTFQSCSITILEGSECKHTLYNTCTTIRPRYPMFPENFSRFSPAHYRLILKWCAKAGLFGDDAIEVANEVVGGFLEFCRTNAPSNLVEWLRLATNRVVRQRLRQRNQASTDEFDSIESHTNPPEHDNRVRHLFLVAMNVVLNSFGKEWKVVAPFFCDGVPLLQIAKKTGVPYATLHRMKTRVQSAIRSTLENEIELEPHLGNALQ